MWAEKAKWVENRCERLSVILEHTLSCLQRFSGMNELSWKKNYSKIPKARHFVVQWVKLVKMSVWLTELLLKDSRVNLWKQERSGTRNWILLNRFLDLHMIYMTTDICPWKLLRSWTVIIIIISKTKSPSLRQRRICVICKFEKRLFRGVSRVEICIY